MLLPVLAVAGLLGLVAGLAVYLFMQQKQQADEISGAAQPEAAAAAAPRRAGRAGRDADRLRRQQQREREQEQQQQLRRRRAAQQDESEGEDEEEEQDSDEPPEDPRERRQWERQRQRREEEARRQAKADKISAYEDRRRAKEAEREAKERAQEEEMRRAAEEKQRAEDEEASKWMNMISVEDTGTLEEAAAAEDTGLLGRFVDYIVKRKMVPIEEAATEFGLRSSEVVDRIQGLEAMGRISGVMDERGKFIYISREEMEAVAAHIRTKGRVSIAALAAASNNLIDLEAKTAVEVVRAGGGATTGPMIDFDSMLEEVAA